MVSLYRYDKQKLLPHDTRNVPFPRGQTKGTPAAFSFPRQIRVLPSDGSSASFSAVPSTCICIIAKSSAASSHFFICEETASAPAGPLPDTQCQKANACKPKGRQAFRFLSVDIIPGVQALIRPRFIRRYAGNELRDIGLSRKRIDIIADQRTCV